MPRREIVNEIVGPGGFTHVFGPDTIQTLLDIGLIEKAYSVESSYPEKGLTVQVNSYRKA